MRRSTDGILTTHTGSLPRPERLTRLIWALQDGEDVSGELDAVLPGEVAAIVARQKAAGIAVVNDGEISKPGFANYISTRLEGVGGETDMWTFADLEAVPDLKAAQFANEAAAHINMPATIGELRYIGHDELQRDIANLTAAAAASGVDEVFMSSASPGILAYHVTNRHYGSYEDYLDALAEAMRPEYLAIAEAGLVLQLDSPDLAVTAPTHSHFWATETAERLGHRGIVERNIEALNAATEGIPAEQIRLHLRDVLQPVLEHARVGAVSFEAANPRHEHEWRVFDDVDLLDGKLIIPGVIDTLTNFVEHPQVVADRIERFAGRVGRENVIAGNDCGFGTFAGFGEVFPDVAWMKLESLGEGARLASERLWA
jgi:5-methyltetrahydropteroyltriglutamate--homocysteine methyltransferase